MADRLTRFPTALLVGRYISARSRRGITKERLAKINQVLREFTREVPTDIRKINRSHVEHFLERPNLAPSTLRQRLSIVRTFMHWAQIEGHVKRDPTLGVESIEQPPKLPGALPRPKAEALHAVLASVEPRLRLMLSLELNDGLRRVELARAQIGDIDHRTHIIRARGKASGGRGAPTHVASLSDETVAALAAYLASEPGIIGLATLSSGPLFRNRNRPAQPLGRKYIGQLVADTLYELGIKERPHDGVAGHALRHTAATEALESGVRMPIVQRQLGHASEATTSIYTKGAAFDLHKFHERERPKGKP